MSIENLTAYEIVEDREIRDLNSRGVILRHKKTGARIVLLSNDDPNKVFYIGFRTPPTDSTGVAHIIEHSVLCGSEKYPVKDPFVELAKGSLNTFLNAMTYPDKTVYPVASCNDKDFANLCDVYLDAVFHPNIYKEKKIFEQEGWHYECESETDDLIYNGVVYNEMKGAYSSADDLLDRETFNSLYPDTAYGVDSGGRPSDIPSLTYEAFLDFHRRYYHPSNSYIYFYGDMDMEERLTYLDEAYLSKFDMLKIDSAIRLQKPFAAPVQVEKKYPVLDSDDITNAAYYSYNVSICSSLDRQLYIALQVLDYALCSAPGAPVKVALMEKGIGEDVYSVCENGILQPYFSFVAKNAGLSDQKAFVETVEQALREQVKNGIDKNALLAAINCYEFKYKEADFGAYPKGLMYGLQALDSWLYDDKAPFMHIEANETFDALKKLVQTDYFEQLVENQILNNTHKSIVSLLPEKGMESRESEKLKEILAKKKASLSAEELQAVIAETKALKAYQEEESSPEDLAKIPVLKREDLGKEAHPFLNEKEPFENTILLSHPIFTNGVSYLHIVFKIRDIKKEQLPYLGLLKNVLGLLSTEKRSYGELFNEINLQTGGIIFDAATYTDAKDYSKFELTFEARAKVLYGNTPKAVDLIREILTQSVFDDEKRLKEILGEVKARLQAQMTSAGHSTASLRALSYISESAWASDRFSGLGFFRFLTDLYNHFDERKAECIREMKTLLSFILNGNRVLYDYTGTEEGKKLFMEALLPFHKGLSAENNVQEAFRADPVKKQEGLCTSAGVQYVCRAGDFRKAGLPYTGALRVLRIMMGYDYLWIRVRVKGGAYGCMSNFTKSGLSYFVSYRDPNLEKTVAVYEKAPAYLREFAADEEIMTKYVIGAISEKDTPLPPSAQGSRSFGAYMSGYSFAEEQQERDEILSCQVADIHALSAQVSAMLETGAFCVVGNEDKIKEQADSFLCVETLV